MLRKLVPAGLVIVLVAATGCGFRRPPIAAPPSSPGQNLIEEMKAFETSLGIQATKNFLRYSDSAWSVYRCYLTGKLGSPASYRGLQLGKSSESGCAADEEKYDVFFYPAEAVASGEHPVTPALVNAALERLLVVVPHEDFHDQMETRESSADVAEAAATLIGFLAASEFAKNKYGPTSQTFGNLNREARLFLEKARIVNRYYDEVSALYSSFRSHQVTRQIALDRKQEMFAGLLQECTAIAPDPVSFNKCPAAMNNAGLSFDRTYSRQYPMMFDLYVHLGQDTKTTILSLRRLLAAWPKAATEATDLISALEVVSP